MSTYKPPAERFWPKVRQDGECWVWIAHCGRGGYGSFYDGQRKVVAHRWAYECMVGPIPDGLFLDHLCRNPSCVNPWHLEPVTARVNWERGEAANVASAARTTCVQGHDYTPRNTLITRKGARKCRTCHNATAKRSRDRRAA